MVYSAHSPPPEFYASKFFVGAQALGALGVIDPNPLIAREVEELLRAPTRSWCWLQPQVRIAARYNVISLARIGTLVTDDGLGPENKKMLEEAASRSSSPRRRNRQGIMTELAVLDVGKTNAKLIAFSRDGKILEQIRHPQQVVIENGVRVLDVDGIFGWLDAALADLRGRHDSAD